MNKAELLVKIEQVKKERKILAQEYWEKVDNNPNFDPNKPQYRELDRELEAKSWAKECEHVDLDHQLRMILIKEPSNI